MSSLRFLFSFSCVWPVDAKCLYTALSSERESRGAPVQRELSHIEVPLAQHLVNLMSEWMRGAGASCQYSRQVGGF